MTMDPNNGSAAQYKRNCAKYHSGSDPLDQYAASGNDLWDNHPSEIDEPDGVKLGENPSDLRYSLMMEAFNGVSLSVKHCWQQWQGGVKEGISRKQNSK